MHVPSSVSSSQTACRQNPSSSEPCLLSMTVSCRQKTGHEASHLPLRREKHLPCWENTSNCCCCQIPNLSSTEQASISMYYTAAVSKETQQSCDFMTTSVFLCLTHTHTSFHLWGSAATRLFTPLHADTLKIDKSLKIKHANLLI